MTDIVALLQPIQSCLSRTTLRQMSRIIVAMLAMTGRVTMLGLSRWAGTGGSYRTVQRFFYTAIPWAQVFWQFFRQHLFHPEDVSLLAGDDCVVTKSGKKTFGLDRFFSGLLRRPVPGLSFFTLSVISVRQRCSYPLRVEQVVRSDEEKTACQAKAKAQKTGAQAPRRKPGRPKGSRNKNKAEVVLNPELLRIQKMILDLLKMMDPLLRPTYLLLDGHFGNYPTLHMARQCGLHLISKLRCDAALYFPYEGPYCGHGPHRKYGERVDYHNLPERYLRTLIVEDGIETRIYQAHLLHREFSDPLNVVILVKTNLSTRAWAYVLLFSSDPTLPYDKLVEYYSLRFQIEFNFRDAKQFWGLEDFMNVTPTAVTNAANLAMFMVNLSQVLMCEFRQTVPDFSILDLKACYRGFKYAAEMIKLLPQKPEASLVTQIFHKVIALGSIHTAQTALFST